MWPRQLLSITYKFESSERKFQQLHFLQGLETTKLFQRLGIQLLPFMQ